jgi:hypothetical protein
VDGKTFAAAPLQRTVKAADGTEKTEPVPPSEYRAWRWTLNELPAGQTFTASVRTRLTSPAPPPAAQP